MGDLGLGQSCLTEGHTPEVLMNLSKCHFITLLLQKTYSYLQEENRDFRLQKEW